MKEIGRKTTLNIDVKSVPVSDLSNTCIMEI